VADLRVGGGCQRSMHGCDAHRTESGQEPAAAKLDHPQNQPKVPVHPGLLDNDMG